jgi:excisionase family DNA binding protein
MSGGADRWWCTQAEAARRLRVTEKIVHSMIVAGQLHRVRLGRRQVIPVAEVEAILREWGQDAPNGAGVAGR